MRRTAFLFGLLSLFLGTTQFALHAEPPHLELVRGLRKEGLTDLALEYLERLATSTDPEVKMLLPLENARTRLDLASMESDEGKRSAILARARSEFDQFIRQNPQHPLVPTANIELARLISFQGNQTLIRSRRAESPEAAKAQRVNARALFQESAKRFDEAAKQIELTIKKTEADETPQGKELLQTLTDAKLNAELDRGINLYNLGQTYSTGADAEPKDIAERGKWINDARKIFSTVGFRDATIPQAYIARAWEAQCSYETQTGTADKEFASLFEQKGEVAKPGVRLGKAFRVRHTYDDLTLKDRFASTARRGLDWLREFPTAAKTPEGVMVRYYIALAKENDARSEIGRDEKGVAIKISASALRMLQDAEDRFREIADGDNEYSERAARRRMECILDRTDATRDKSLGETRPEDMKTFQEAYIQALVTQARLPATIKQLQVEMEEDLKNVPDGEREKKTKEWENHLHRAEDEGRQKLIDFLNRAVELFQPADSKKDLIDARVLMAYQYQILRQFEAAAVMAEFVFRQAPESNQAAPMARLAVNSYLNAMTVSRRGQKLSPEELAADAKRVKSVGLTMEQKFPTDPATDPVRHNLAYLFSVERNYPEALRLYSSIQPSYADLAQARLEQGSVLYLYLRSQVSDQARGQQFADEIQAAIAKPEINSYWRKTLAELTSLPAPAITAELDAISDYAKAKSQLALLYQVEGKQYQRLEEIGKELEEYLVKASQLAGATKADLVCNAIAIRLTGTYGKAYLLMQGKGPDYLKKVAELLDPAIEEFKKSSTDTASIATPGGEKMRRAQKDVIVLALRGSVQEGKIDRAKTLLDLLQLAKSETEDTTQILQQLVNTIRLQIDALKSEKKLEEAADLVKSFSEFIETVAKQVATETAKTPEDERRLNAMKLFLARGFGDVENYAKAIELLEGVLAKMPEPKTEEQTKFKAQAQYALARNARLGGEFKKAESVLAELIGTPQKRGVGYGTLEIRKERARLLEDQSLFAPAITEWQTLVRLFVGQLPAIPPDVQEGDTNEVRQQKQKVRNEAMLKRRTYFDLFYETYRAQARAYDALDTKKYSEQQKIDGITKAAQKFVDLEVNTDLSDELKDKIRETFEQYPLLKEKYKERGGKVFLTTSEK